jgi:hypothetical protein
MPDKKYFGIADTITAEGYIRQKHDIMLLEFGHVTYNNEDERLVISIDEHVAEGLWKILKERYEIRDE